ncbi:hypothetical protein BDZ97DRAFT_1224657 [Flammula alnicola]|nr:hypothetical protein BDZ97DRAFT_1224657 [Flammula alnicola]
MQLVWEKQISLVSGTAPLTNKRPHCFVHRSSVLIVLTSSAYGLPANPKAKEDVLRRRDFIWVDIIVSSLTSLLAVIALRSTEIRTQRISRSNRTDIHRGPRSVRIYSIPEVFVDFQVYLQHLHASDLHKYHIVACSFDQLLPHSRSLYSAWQLWRSSER